VAAQSADNLARRLRVLLPVKDKAGKCVGNPESIDRRPHRLPAQVRAKREVEEREGKVPMVNLAASQEADRLRLLQLSADKGSPSAERKRARGPHRHEDHNDFLLIVVAAPEQKSEAALFERVFCSAFAAANTNSEDRGRSYQLAGSINSTAGK
jgi:hypothetical protein